MVRWGKQNVPRPTIADRYCPRSTGSPFQTWWIYYRMFHALHMAPLKLSLCVLRMWKFMHNWGYRALPIPCRFVFGVAQRSTNPPWPRHCGADLLRSNTSSLAQSFAYGPTRLPCRCAPFKSWREASHPASDGQDQFRIIPHLCDWPE